MHRAVLACVLAAACDRTSDADAPDPRPAAVPDVALEAHAAASPLPTIASPPLDDRADEARAVMSARCGMCHLPDASDQPRALTVFDLSHDDWSATLSDEQLLDIETRLVDGGAPFDEVDAVRTFLGAARD